MLTFAFRELSLPWLDAKVPELMHSAHWKHLSDWSARYGWWVLAGIAASPISQAPALLVAAMLGMPMGDVFVAVALGKSLKYGLVARAAQLVANQAAVVDRTTDKIEAGDGTDQARR